MKRIKHLKVLSIAVAFILVFSVVFPLSTRAENSSEEKFTAEQSINGTKVTVSADPEVFPEGTTMEVKEVNLTSTEDSLVASQQQADQKSIKKVALDITMKNKEGQEIEPDTSKGKVHVSFTNDDIKNHTTNVYHIDDNLKVESLKLTKSDDTVTGETTGFSTYVLDFVVGSKTIYYGLSLNEEINLSEQLAKLLDVTASSITSVSAVNPTKFTEYGKLEEKSDKNWYITITKELSADNGQLSFNVNYTDNTNKAATTTLQIQVYKQPTFTGDASWIKDYQASRDDHAHTITLTKYNGTGENLSIPGSVKIDGTDYQIVIRGNVYASCSTLKSIVFQDGVRADETLASLFYHCPNLTKVDLSALDTSNVTDMSSMFFWCESIVNDGTDSYIKFATKDGPSRFDTSNVKTMADMFYNMQGLVKLDVSMFKITDSLEDMDRFAAANSKLKEIDLSAFKGAVSKNASQANADDALAPLTWSTKLEKITLGKDWKPKDNQKYLGLGITGNWKNIATNDVVTNEDLINYYTSAMAGTYISTPEAPSVATRALYVADGYTKKDNMWEVHTPQFKFHGYCLDHKRLQPSGYFDKIAIDKNATSNTSAEGEPSNWIMDYLDLGNTGYKPLGNNMTEALIALIYWSQYGAGTNGPYNQEDIWHFTNDYSSGISEELNAKINGLTYNGIDYKEKHTFDSIPSTIRNKLKLYIYMPSTLNTDPNKDNMQNLLSIEGANDQTYAGLQVKKVDNSNPTKPVAGAEFSVYRAKVDENGTLIRDADGNPIKDTNFKFGTNEDHLSFTTNSLGIGGIYRMDRTVGLTPGWYILKEEKAPKGYVKNGNTFVINVKDGQQPDGDDQRLIDYFVEFQDGQMIKKPLVIEDKIDKTYDGGGITLKKVDAANSKKLLMNAEFKLYKVTTKDGKETEEYEKTYTTDASGVLKTGNKDLKIDQTYVLRETKAPEGYSNLQSNGQQFEQRITLTKAQKDTIVDLGTVNNVAKIGSIELKAHKKLIKNGIESIPTANQFRFQLLDENHQPIGSEVGNDADGNITFSPTQISELNFTAADMPGKTFYIKEVIPETVDSSLDYDTHEERVQVMISDNGTKTLTCVAQSDGDVTFVNTTKLTFEAKLNVHKIVTNSLSSSDEFNFYVEIQSPAADLDSKEFNYTLGEKTGKFKFNRLSTKANGLYRYKTAEGTFKLKDQSTLQITGLPNEANYIVTEEEYDSYTLKKISVGNDSDGYKDVNLTNSKQEASGTLPTKDGKEVTVKFTNEGHSIIPTSADSMTRMSFWILGTAGALVLVLILKRRLKVSKK